MVGARGRVIGIEHIPELIEISARNVREDNPHFLKEGRIKFVGELQTLLSTFVLAVIVPGMFLHQTVIPPLVCVALFLYTHHLSIKKKNHHTIVQDHQILHVCIVRIKDTRDPSTWSRYVRCREESNGTLSTDCMALL